MKNLLSFLCVFLVSLTVLAQKQEVIWGYSGASIGAGHDMGDTYPIKCAILIPQSVLAHYKGCTITKIEVCDEQEVSELVPLICIGDGDNLVKQTPRGGVRGRNVIELETPYVISGADDLYVGCECVATYALSAVYLECTNGAYIFYNDEWLYSGDDVAYCIRAHIEGENMPIDVSLSCNKVLECSKGANLVAHPSVLNLSPEKVESVKLACYVDNEFSGFYEVKLDLEKGDLTSVDLNFTAPEVEGEHAIRVVVESVNGKVDEITGNNEISIPVTVYGKTFPRRVVMEELTGTWCGWCVRGYVALQEMAEKYPDSFIGLAYHTDDEMSDIENAQEIIDILDNPLPTGAVNRNTQTIFNCEPETLEDYIQELKNLALADIRGEVTVLDADTTAVKVNTYTEFAADATQPFAIAYVVLENGVGPYVQANNFSGADYEFYGYEKQGRHVVLVYNDVVRSVYGGAAGVEGSVPSEIHQGQTYEYQYELPLPSNVKCKSNIEVVALLMNQENGQIVNACKCSFNKNADAISTLKPANPGKSVAVYNVGGAQLNAPQRGLNLVKMSDGSVGKIVK